MVPFRRSWRTDQQRCSHAAQQKYTPFGLLEEDTGQFNLCFGAPAKTSYFIVDSLQAWWDPLPQAERQAISPPPDQSRQRPGRCPQFFARLVAFADVIATPIQLLYYPPYHSKHNPIERGWGLLEKH